MPSGRGKIGHKNWLTEGVARQWGGLKRRTRKTNKTRDRGRDDRDWATHVVGDRLEGRSLRDESVDHGRLVEDDGPGEGRVAVLRQTDGSHVPTVDAASMYTHLLLSRTHTLYMHTPNTRARTHTHTHTRTRTRTRTRTHTHTFVNGIWIAGVLLLHFA